MENNVLMPGDAAGNYDKKWCKFSPSLRQMRGKFETN